MPQIFHVLRSRATVVAFIAILLVAGCGGGGGGVSKMKLEDAAIYGALVVDSKGMKGVSIGDGIYQFKDNNGSDTVPTLPIKVNSQNLIDNGMVNITNVDGVWYSYKGSAKAPLTFQDLDGDGKYTPSVDIPYNGSFTLNYSASGSSQINANPVTALIPAGWDGTKVIAGLSADILKAASSTGVKDSNNAELKRATSLLTAISDVLALSGKSADAINSIFGAVATGQGVNLLATGPGLQNAASALAAVLDGVIPGSGTLASNLQTIAGNSVVDLKNFEALVAVAQNNVTVIQSGSADLTQLALDVGNSDKNITTAQTNVTSGNDLTAQIAKLRIVPFCDLVKDTPAACDPTTAAPWEAFGKLTGFAVNLQTNGSMTVTKGSWVSSWFNADSISLPFVSSSNSWLATSGNASAEIVIGTEVTLPDSTKFKGNYLKLCSQANTCMPFFLATNAGVCSLVTTNSVVNTALLAKINLLQAADRQVKCP
jgi:hypothetical protein